MKNPKRARTLYVILRYGCRQKRTDEFIPRPGLAGQPPTGLPIHVAQQVCEAQAEHPRHKTALGAS